jgi:hypothetical protein
LIIYDLKCEKGHTFEGWFKDRKAFEKQKEQKMIACPVCGSFEARELPSSPKIVTRHSGRDSEKNSPKAHRPSVLQKFHEYINKHFEDVGERFAEVALNIFHGKEDPRNIKGTTTKREEDALKDEGVKFIKVPLPKLDS